MSDVRRPQLAAQLDAERQSACAVGRLGSSLVLLRLAAQAEGPCLW